jgi:hypothetical protein
VNSRSPEEITGVTVKWRYGRTLRGCELDYTGLRQGMLMGLCGIGSEASGCTTTDTTLDEREDGKVIQSNLGLRT